MELDSREGPNPDVPPELSQFAFLIGAWRADRKLKGDDGKWKPFTADWTARYILGGYVITDEFHTNDTGSEFSVARRDISLVRCAAKDMGDEIPQRPRIILA